MKKFLFTALKIVLFFIGWAVLIGIIDIPNDNPALWRFFAELTPLIVIVFFTAIFLLIEKKSIKIPLKKNIIKASIVVTVINIALIILFYIRYRKNIKTKKDNFNTKVPNHS